MHGNFILDAPVVRAETVVLLEERKKFVAISPVSQKYVIVFDEVGQTFSEQENHQNNNGNTDK